MTTTTHPMADKPIGQLLRQFAVPSIIAMLVSSLYNIVDQIFVGNMIGYVAKERVDGKLILPEAVQILKLKASTPSGGGTE